MVSISCKMVVKMELEKLGLHCTLVELGQVETLENISADQIKKIKSGLSKSGLELMDNKKNILIERIKNTIVEMVHYSDCQIKTNFSAYLSSKLNLDYTYLSNTFSAIEGITIEHFIILYKIKRIKELIVYNELSLTEISWKLNYSSVGHLSAQFKKVTGVTPSYFRHLECKARVA
jgi:AraC-like DNA-binding protein